MNTEPILYEGATRIAALMVARSSALIHVNAMDGELTRVGPILQRAGT